MSTLERIVDEKYDGCKIREFLKEEMELSSRLIRKSALDKKILVNNEWVKMNFKIKKGDKSSSILF